MARIVLAPFENVQNLPAVQLWHWDHLVRTLRQGSTGNQEVEREGLEHFPWCALNNQPLEMESIWIPEYDLYICVAYVSFLTIRPLDLKAFDCIISWFHSWSWFLRSGTFFVMVSIWMNSWLTRLTKLAWLCVDSDSPFVQDPSFVSKERLQRGFTRVLDHSIDKQTSLHRYCTYLPVAFTLFWSVAFTCHSQNQLHFSNIDQVFLYQCHIFCIPLILYHVNHVWVRLMCKICASICEEVSEEDLVLQGLLADGALPTPSHTQNSHGTDNIQWSKD